AVRGREELGPVLLDDIGVESPDGPGGTALAVVKVEADVVRLPADGDSAMTVDRVRGRLDPVQRVRSLDVEGPGQRNRETHLDCAREAGRPGQVVDPGGRKRDENDQDRDPDGDELSPSPWRNRRRCLTVCWLGEP